MLTTAAIVLAVLTQTTPTTPTTPTIAAPATPAAPVKAEPEVKAKPQVYNETADAKKEIDAALAKAKKNNRRVLVQWGANWCGWCIQLHDLFGKNAEIKKTLSYEYDVVYVDIGQWNKHMDLAKAYGADLKGKGVPYLTILDADGKVVTNQDTTPLENKTPSGESTTGHDPAKVVEFLKKNQAAQADAQATLSTALESAKKSNKQVFLHFGAPWCGWCHRLEDWMDQPKVAELLAKDFVDCKIDMDRMKGAAEIAKKYRAKEGGGIPWFCFLTADGTKGADSDGPDGNVGFPY